MTYAYYPGCSLTASARDYDLSVRTVMTALGIELEEINDWNCCGASAAPSVDPFLGVALSARNLAMAEAKQRDVAVACPSCYTNLRRARVTATAATDAGKRVRESLADGGYTVSGGSEVRHLLDLVVHEVGLTAIRSRVKRPLTGLKVAPYYGCQLSRPHGSFAHPEIPYEMDELLKALGAEPVRWNGRTRCCGASAMLTKESAALQLVDKLLTSAEESGAYLIATACSLCHMNLDAYQGRVNGDLGKSHKLPVVYFTQLLGLALGLEPSGLGLGKAFIPAPMLDPYLEGVRA
ncbi:MAG TPA: CoB--CoM heterodisulfide reductase iron-sulfur subunit B family protein [Symbiobacteriaceae bacterium]|nr:CoB--CoM heterodisulfide reductase iron-sulfur subunit B family protein [Symbiobacteriaceae bacterium]